ncbi:MAG: flagellar biosynthetic protein FliR [Myxococcales bacterium]|nr:flagellar biosynthetic protein FliR [Myxococcales bacterium]
MQRLAGSLQDGIVFLPVFFRVGALFIMLPIVGDERVPPTNRVAITLMVALAVASTLNVRVAIPGTVTELALGLGLEFAFGLAIGTAVKVVFAGVELAGQIIGYQAGLAAANVIDPMSQSQKPLVSELLFLSSMLLILTLNIHHVFLRTIVASFAVVPPLGAHMSAEVSNYILELGGAVFTLAFRIAAPMIAILLLAKLGLGLIARTSPQFNIFSVGFVLLTIVGLGALYAAMPYMFATVRHELYALGGRMDWLLRLF